MVLFCIPLLEREILSSRTLLVNLSGFSVWTIQCSKQAASYMCNHNRRFFWRFFHCCDHPFKPDILISSICILLQKRICCSATRRDNPVSKPCLRQSLQSYLNVPSRQAQRCIYRSREKPTIAQVHDTLTCISIERTWDAILAATVK
jgi:hypothetical protein